MKHKKDNVLFFLNRFWCCSLLVMFLGSATAPARVWWIIRYLNTIQIVGPNSSIHTWYSAFLIPNSFRFLVFVYFGILNSIQFQVFENRTKYLSKYFHNFFNKIVVSDKYVNFSCLLFSKRAVDLFYQVNGTTSNHRDGPILRG